ncbi:MAG: ZPR1 zinc finger domain-containing protein [Methanocorpusculum sp.]|nr:ZPR1 zinc finger domain-containing protein [Methanocorpusculum sp.]
MRQVILNPCPDCGTEIGYIYDTENIPYFSDILLISAVCSKCGFKLVDTMLLNEREPCSWELKAETPEDLNARVVRSSQGEIDLPDFGINIMPGPACEAFVSNIEGVLQRAEDGVRTAVRASDGEETKRAKEILADIEKAKNCQMPFTVRIIDESGNSGIVSSKAVKTKLDVERKDGTFFTPY